MHSKKYAIFPFLLLIPFFLFAQQDKMNVSGNQALPDVEIRNLDGVAFNTHNISNNGAPVIICFWATYCKPCIKELSIISDLYDDWRQETGVKIVAISIDDSKTIANVLPFVNGKGWEYEFYTDVNGDFKRAMNVNVIPHTFILNSKSEIVWQHLSFAEGDELKYIEIVRILLKDKMNPK